MDATAQSLTAYILTFLGGAAGVEIIRTVTSGITGSLKRRRAEVDRIARDKTDADDARVRAERRERIATEHAHRVRVIAIRAGLEVPDFPDLGD